MQPTLKLAGGTLYDPAHGIDGQVRDVWIAEGKIAAAPADASVAAVRTIDCRGMVVMPGGVDMHCHIAGSKVNAGRKLRPEDQRSTDPRQSEPVRRTPWTRSGVTGSVPSTFATGYKYAGLGYTTAFDAAVPPLGARQAHAELADTPCLDKGFYVLLGNNHFVLEAIGKKQPERLQAFVGWLLNAAKAYAVKIVNPGGVELWKQRVGATIHGLDDQVAPFDVTPRQIIQGLAQAADDLRLPHSVHIHANHLGLPGNWTTTQATMEALEGRRGHLTHIQFHSYGGGDGDENTFNSKALPLAEYVNAHPNITVDVGQVLFGGTTSMTGDGPLGYYLQRLFGAKWYSCDVESEAGCGVSPIEYKNKNLVHTVQWAVGLEWYLLVNDPWRVAMSTDHPNGGSFMAYPQIIRLLMDRDYRLGMLAKVHPKVRERTILADLDRQYTLNDIAIITRAGPARMLGLTQKGHLGPGADADVTVYTPHDDKELMFQLPRHVIKAGELVVENGELRWPQPGETLYVSPEYDPDIERELAAWFPEHYSIRSANYPVGEVPGARAAPCGPQS